MAKILVIEDEDLVLEAMRIMLEEGGHCVTSAANGQEGMNALKAARFDVIVTDIVMPEVDGLELLTEVKKLYPDTKIVAVSGGGRISPSDYLQTAKVLGADCILSKPFAMSDLVNSVNEVLA